MRTASAEVFDATPGASLNAAVILQSGNRSLEKNPTSASSATTFDIEQLSTSDKSSRKSSSLDVRLRRLRANDRERRRIQSINGAMEALRRVIPDTKNDRKVTKLQLLKLAQNYIRYLSEMLTMSSSTHTMINQGTTYRTSSGRKDLDSFSFNNQTCDFVHDDISFAQYNTSLNS